MNTTPRKLLSFAAIIGIGTALLATPGFAADKIKLGQLRGANVSFVATEKGFYAEQGIEVETVFFRSGAALVPALSTGQIDVAMTSAGAALYNAMAQGINARIVASYSVADLGRPGGDPNAISVRQDLLDSGKVKTAKDLKGMTIAITARGQFTDLFVSELLKSAGLTENDVRIVSMPYPDMVAAFQGKSIDAASMLDPYLTTAETQKIASPLMRLSKLLPGYTLGVVMYGDRVGKENRDLGMRFMRALHKANAYVRKVIDTEAGRNEIAAIYQKHVPQRSVDVYANPKMGESLGRATLAADVDGPHGLRWQLEWSTAQKLVPKAPDLNKAVDNTFAAAADKGS